MDVIELNLGQETAGSGCGTVCIKVYISGSVCGKHPVLFSCVCGKSHGEIMSRG